MWLEREFSVEEIKAVLDGLVGDKALGSDGFNFNFFQACWEIVGLDFLRFFREFHQTGVVDISLKNSFITMVPKREGPSKLLHYRPISLVGSV